VKFRLSSRFLGLVHGNVGISKGNSVYVQSNLPENGIGSIPGNIISPLISALSAAWAVVIPTSFKSKHTSGWGLVYDTVFFLVSK
jgi:hypothetical protein